MEEVGAVKTLNRRILIIPLLVFFLFLVFYSLNAGVQEDNICGDGTLDGGCSLNRPYFCKNGVLIEKASFCGCPEVLDKQRDQCISPFQNNPKNISLKYILRGKEREMDFVVYEDLANYIAGSPKHIYYEKGKEPLRSDFKMRNIDNQQQRELLIPLVIQIQNLFKDKTDQFRVAVSIVQNIPFGSSDKVVTLNSNQQVAYSRYPYEVLYDSQGVCGEKSELLAFLLKEMGYGVVLFYHKPENHESIGIKCPPEYSLDGTGYCFIETSGPSIITNNQLVYAGSVKLYSDPELILISKGDSLPKDMYEYDDSREFIKNNKAIRERGSLNFISHFKLKKLNKKYGLVDYYNL